MQETKLFTERPFQFKKFSISQDRCAMKVGTDGVLLGVWADAAMGGRILDIGTGTGLIAIMLAQRSTDAIIDAVEIDAEAYEQALGNMENSPWTDRLHVIHDSIQNYSKTAQAHYDLIVSNPPFFSGGTFSDRQDRTSVRHTVKLPHGDLLQAGRKLLNPQGKFCVILPYLEGLRFVELAKTYRLHCTKMNEVRPRKEKPVERLLLQFEMEPKAVVIEELTIHDAGDDYTQEFIALTNEFYMKF